MASRGLSLKDWIGALFGLFIFHILLIAAIAIPGIFFVTLSNIMSSTFTMYSNPQKFISDFVNKSVELNECRDLCKITLLPTHNATLQNVTILTLQRKIANITIVNPQNVLVFVNLTSDGQEKWIYTFYDARIIALFAGNLDVSVYPAFPLSDARPRKLAFQENGTRTVHVSSQLGGTIDRLVSTLVSVVGALAAIGVIKRVMATPASDMMSKSTHPFAPLTALFYLIFSFLVVLLLAALAFYEPRNPGLVFFLFPILLLLLSISVLMTGRFWPGLAIFLAFSLIFYRDISAMWQLLFSLKLDSGTILLILLFYVLYPFFYVLGKVAAFAFSTDRMFKLYLMYIYDITLFLWAIQWLVNPYPTLLSWELLLMLGAGISFILGLLSIIIQIIIQNVVLAVIPIVLFVTLYTISYFIFRTRNISFWLLNLPNLPLSLSLTVRYIRGFAWLLPAVPFVLNRELVARGELCASAERGVVKVKIYPEDCCDPVEGVVVDCSLDKIAVDGNAERRVFSWGDVRQIELIG